MDLSYKPTDENSDPAFQHLTRSLWNATKFVVPTIKRIHEVKLRHVAAVELARKVCFAVSLMTTTEITEFFKEQEMLAGAVSRGIHELVKLWIKFLRERFWFPDHRASLRTFTVVHRRESMFRLFLKGNSTNELSFILEPVRKNGIKLCSQ